MFDRSDVDSIHRLVALAEKGGSLNGRTQLRRLSRWAASIPGAELELEIDERALARKLTREFANGLKAALAGIAGEDDPARAKRGLLIRHIAKLRRDDSGGLREAEPDRRTQGSVHRAEQPRGARR